MPISRSASRLPSLPINSVTTGALSRGRRCSKPSESEGLLQRRPLESAPVVTELIGKEGNRLAERLIGIDVDASDYRNTYGERVDYWDGLILPILAELGAVDEI